LKPSWNSPGQFDRHQKPPLVLQAIRTHCAAVRKTHAPPIGSLDAYDRARNAIRRSRPTLDWGKLSDDFRLEVLSLEEPQAELEPANCDRSTLDRGPSDNDRSWVPIQAIGLLAKKGSYLDHRFTERRTD
jgi:hypothetical protein